MKRRKHITVKDILLRDHNWYRFSIQYASRIRPAIKEHIVKLLSCRKLARGYLHYHCSNPKCSHTKRVPHTCKGKACSSCGKKQTETWIAIQKQILPQTTWQHITMTMPDAFWDLFWLNRKMLKKLPAIGARILLELAKKKGILPGIFIALHTFGRDLKRNVHLHLSATLGGLTLDSNQWKKLYFSIKAIMPMWRMRVIRMIRKMAKAGKLKLPASLRNRYPTYSKLSAWLDVQYKKYWHVHAQKPSTSHKLNIEYLGKYTKRPPIANARIYEYSSEKVSFGYLDHHTKTYRRFTCTPFEFIRRWIQHLPDTSFRMIRYYGFLSNQKRGALLPKVFELLDLKHQEPAITPSYAMLMQKTFGINPLKCILCGSDLFLDGIHFGLSRFELQMAHDTLALGKPVQI